MDLVKSSSRWISGDTSGTWDTGAAVRYMDWNDTNASQVANWSQRNLLSNATWSESNVPLEVQIALANRLQAVPWFNIPTKSDDDYSTQFAQLVTQRMSPALGLYVEYSNEVWNSSFSQYTYAGQQATALGIDRDQFYAKRSNTIGTIFKQALGATRVVATLCGQYVNTYGVTHGLDYLRTLYGNNGVIDTICSAPYFAVMPSTGGKYDTMSLTDFFTYVDGTIIPQAIGYMQDFEAAATKYGTHYVSYEGGQSMVGVGSAVDDTKLNALFDAFNRDPRIKNSYTNYLNGWKQSSAQLFMHFNDVGRYTKWGRWGSMESLLDDRTTAPKFDALQAFIEQNPVWWLQQ